jgi:hypothetical protein
MFCCQIELYGSDLPLASPDMVSSSSEDDEEGMTYILVILSNQGFPVLLWSDEETFRTWLIRVILQ